MISIRVFLSVAAIMTASVAHAGPTAEQACQAGRANAAAKYAQCTQKALARFYLTGAVLLPRPVPYAKALGKCVAKYSATWPQLQARAVNTGATCDDARFLDSGATIVDRLSGLEWEKKGSLDLVTNYADPHDGDNPYSWSVSGTLPNGTAFQNILRTLNDACFAGKCDWRLPTRDELLTLTSPAYPACVTPPCVDPTFLPTRVGAYWSADTYANDPATAWIVQFDDGSPLATPKTQGFFVRVVRTHS